MFDAFLTMDMETTFNQIDRSCFLREIRRVAPGLARYCDLCYSKDSFVLFGPEKSPSQSEVQQGDPLGSLALRPWPSRGHPEGAITSRSHQLPRGHGDLLP